MLIHACSLLAPSKESVNCVLEGGNLTEMRLMTNSPRSKIRRNHASAIELLEPQRFQCSSQSPPAELHRGSGTWDRSTVESLEAEDLELIFCSITVKENSTVAVQCIGTRDAYAA